MTWRYYFPDDGETAEDAQVLPLPNNITTASDAAELACGRDYYFHDGWEREQREFTIAIICPDETETRFMAWHEPTVQHCIERIEQ